MRWTRPSPSPSRSPSPTARRQSRAAVVFLVYRDAGTKAAAVVDFRETAPAAIDADDVPRCARHRGSQPRPPRVISPAGTPGVGRRDGAAHQKYRAAPVEAASAPPIRLAQRGFRVTKAFSDQIADEADGLAKYPSSAAIFPAGRRSARRGDLSSASPISRARSRRIAEGGRGRLLSRTRRSRHSALDARAHGADLGTERPRELSRAHSAVRSRRPTGTCACSTPAAVERRSPAHRDPEHARAAADRAADGLLDASGAPDGGDREAGLRGPALRSWATRTSSTFRSAR
jgi:hypothetical protein